MATSATAVFFRRGGETISSYITGGRDDELEALAAECLRKAQPPRHHSWYSHTEEAWTFGYLKEEEGEAEEDDAYYFAVVDTSSGDITGGEGLIGLLRHVSKSLKKSPDKRIRDAFLPPAVDVDTAISLRDCPAPLPPPMTDAGLSPEKKTRDVAINIVGGGEETTKPRSTTAEKNSERRQTSSSQWRGAKIAAGVDMVLLLVLLGLWLVVRRSFYYAS